MSDQRPDLPDAERLRQEAEAMIESYRSFLASPAFQHSVDLMVLVKIAGDETADIRERRRAAEVLAKLRLQAMEALAELTGTREQALDRLGIKPSGATVALTRINQKIEIVRAKDWRSAAPLEGGVDVEVQALPASDSATNGHEANGAAPQEPVESEAADAEDPAP